MKLLAVSALVGVFLTRSAQGWVSMNLDRKHAFDVDTRRSSMVTTDRRGFISKTTTSTAASVAVVLLCTDAEAKAASPSAAESGGKNVYQPAPSSLKDKVILVTGASTGLGLESAKRLAAAGATVVLTARSIAKGQAAVESVREYMSERGLDASPNQLHSLVLDLDDLESVKAFPAAYEKLGLGKTTIDVLMNNAGVMAIPERELTKDGNERTFQSNHLGHFVLTAGLFPYLSRNGCTVINVSSEAYQFAGKQGLELDNLNGEKEYGPWSSYGQSKLANILFTQELQRRVDESGQGSWLTAVTLHPGAVATDLGRNIVGVEKWDELKTKGPTGIESLALNTASLFTKTVPEGASTQVFLAAASGEGIELQKGAFYENLKPKKLPPFANDAKKAEALWEKSEELGGVRFDVPSATDL